MIGDFHVLRPWWLLGLVGAVLLAWVISRRTDAQARWRGIIAPHLLGPLLLDRPEARRLRPVHLMVTLIALGSIAAAGPTWKRERSPFVEDQAPLAIAVDLSATMDAVDISPTRLERVKLKIRDLLARRPGGRTALFAYAGSAHMVLPLTDDAKLVQTYADALATGIMPVPGRDTVKALAVMEAALRDEPVPGTILLMTDGIEPTAVDAFRNRQGADDVMVLGIGTAEGGPVKRGKDDFLTDATGARVIARLDVTGLDRLHVETRVPVATVTADDADVRWIVRRAHTHLQQMQAEQGTRWQDEGWWLMIPIVILAALWFRQGWTIRWIAVLMVAAATLAPGGAQAEGGRFIDPWLTRDQQGRLAFERGDYAGAATLFTDPMWRGAAYYRAGDFARAAEAFAHAESAESYYDRGNALARLGKLPEAVASYQQALHRRPDWPEAKANLALLQDLIRKQKDDDTEGDQPTEPPDSVQFDEKGKKGKAGPVELARQTAEMWMRNIQTTPTQLLARRFAIEAEQGKP